MTPARSLPGFRFFRSQNLVLERAGMSNQVATLDLAQQVDTYLRSKARVIDEELAHFRRLRLPFAVEEAANARGPDGKMLKHQRRVGGENCEDAGKRLLECLSEIELCKSFAELLQL